MSSLRNKKSSQTVASEQNLTEIKERMNMTEIEEAIQDEQTIKSSSSRSRKVRWSDDKTKNLSQHELELGPGFIKIPMVTNKKRLGKVRKGKELRNYFKQIV